MEKKNELIQSIDTVITKGNEVIHKAKDFIEIAEVFITAAVALREILTKDGDNDE